LTAGSSKKNTKPILLWLDFDQESNSKDIEDFLFFPMGLHMFSYDQWSRRYALSKLMNAAGILRWTDWKELTISNFLSRFKMKPKESLNTKCVDIFFRFPSHICVPHYDKQSSGYDHWKTACGEIFDENLETGWVFERRKEVRFQNGTKIKNRRQGGCFVTIPNWVACGSWNEEHWCYGVPLMAKGHRQGRAWLERFEGLEDLLWRRMLSGIDRRLWSLISWVLKLRSSHRLKEMIRKMG
jgi:hypothetical protein